MRSRFPDGISINIFPTPTVTMPACIFTTSPAVSRPFRRTLSPVCNGCSFGVFTSVLAGCFSFLRCSRRSCRWRNCAILRSIFASASTGVSVCSCCLSSSTWRRATFVRSFSACASLISRIVRSIRLLASASSCLASSLASRIICLRIFCSSTNSF